MATNSGAVRRIMGNLAIQLRSMAVACGGLGYSEFKQLIGLLFEYSQILIPVLAPDAFDSGVHLS
jgi:hypothetical protein